MSVKAGDEVLLEDAWEDTHGGRHDEYVTVAKVLPDGTFTVRLGHWKTRTSKQQVLQAYLNQMEWRAEDYDPEPTQTKGD